MRVILLISLKFTICQLFEYDGGTKTEALHCMQGQLAQKYVEAHPNTLSHQAMFDKQNKNESINHWERTLTSANSKTIHGASFQVQPFVAAVIAESLSTAMPRVLLGLECSLAEYLKSRFGSILPPPILWLRLIRS